jgi:predicted metal-binding protein
VTIRVLICRGCCCGTIEKHPNVDHDEQLRMISRVTTSRVVDCVNECAHSNVVIVRPGDGTSHWFGGILDGASTTALCDWMRDGAKDAPPQELAAHLFTPKDKSVAVSISPSRRP